MVRTLAHIWQLIGDSLDFCMCVMSVVLRIAFTEKAVELKEGESVPLMGVTAVNPFSVEVEVGVVCLELIGTGARPGKRGVTWCDAVWCSIVWHDMVWCSVM